MLLLELFDKAVEWKVDNSNKNMYEISFEIPDGQEIEVFAATYYQKRNDDASPDHIPTRKWTIDFFDKEDSNKHDPYKVTGRGNELVIFSTMIDILHTLLTNHPNDVFTFTAEEPKRKALYDKMLNRSVKPPYAYYNGTKRFFVGKEDVLKQYIEQEGIR